MWKKGHLEARLAHTTIYNALERKPLRAAFKLLASNYQLCYTTTMRRHELTDDQYNRIKHLLPQENKGTGSKGGRPAKNNRIMLNAMMYWLNTGVPWRDLPERFGSWKSVYTRFRRWREQGVWQEMLTALINEDLVDDTSLMLDSTIIKVHQHVPARRRAHEVRVA